MKPGGASCQSFSGGSTTLYCVVDVLELLKLAVDLSHSPWLCSSPVPEIQEADLTTAER